MAGSRLDELQVAVLQPRDHAFDGSWLCEVGQALQKGGHATVVLLRGLPRHRVLGSVLRVSTGSGCCDAGCRGAAIDRRTVRLSL